MIFDALGSITLGDVPNHIQRDVEVESTGPGLFISAMPSNQTLEYHAYSDDCDCGYCWLARGRKDARY